MTMPFLLLIPSLMTLVQELGLGLLFLPPPRAYFVRTEIARTPALWLFRRW